jgi:hypothetical protein
MRARLDRPVAALQHVAARFWRKADGRDAERIAGTPPIAENELAKRVLFLRAQLGDFAMVSPATPTQCAQWRAQLKGLNGELTAWVAKLHAANSQSERQAAQDNVTRLVSETQGLALEIRERCGFPVPPEPVPPIVVTGIEVSQAIQNPENEIPIISGKSTVVRVYLKSSGATFPQATAVLTIDGAASETAGPVVVTASGSNRRTLDGSFVFQIPGSQVTPGQHTFAVSVLAGDSSRHTAHSSVQISVVAQDMQFHTYGVSYGYTNVPATVQTANGLTSSNWPARPFSDFEPARLWAQNVYPVRELAVLQWPGDPHPDFDYQGGDGYIAARMWGQQLIDMMFPGGGERIFVLQPEKNGYYGYTEGSTNGNYVMNGQFIADTGPTFAHELGHSWGLVHTFDPGSPYPESDGWMGNGVGIRVSPQLTLVPGDDAAGNKITFDMMSYTPPFWISPFNYCTLMVAISNKAVAPPAHAYGLVQS